MAKYYSNETKWLGNTPPTPAGDEAYGGRVRVFRATIALDALNVNSSTVVATGGTTADTLSLVQLPPGYRFLKGVINSSVSLGTSTLAIGNAASAGKYRAAATFTTPDTPTNFGLATTEAAVPNVAGEEILATIGVATLPTTAGAKLVIDIFAVGP